MTTFLVTGGAGFLGSALVRRLASAGDRVRVLDSGFRGGLRRLEGAVGDIEVVEGDVRDAALVDRVCEGVAVVLHLAAVNGTSYFYSIPEVVLDVGVRGTLNVIDATIRRGVRELFVASSSEVYQTARAIPTDESVPLTVPDPMNPRYSYAGAKLVSELLAINYGRKHYGRVVVFRPHNVYGPDMGAEHVIPQLTLRLRALARGEADPIRLPIQGTGGESRAFLYVDDLVEGLLVLLARGEHLGIYHIGSEDEVTIAVLAREIARCLGRQVVVVPGERPAGSTPRRCPDISRIRALGFHPRVPLHEGLARTVRWYDEHSHLFAAPIGGEGHAGSRT